MKRIIIAVILLLQANTTVFAKNYKVEYVERETEYRTDSTGKYKILSFIDEQGMIVAQKNGKEGYIDSTGKILIPFLYDEAGLFSECVDLAPVIQNRKQGFINRRGDIVIPLIYDAGPYVNPFYEPGVAIQAKNGRYGVIDAHNNIIIPFKYDSIEWPVTKDYFIVFMGNRWATFSFDGKQLADFNDYEIVITAPLGYLPANSKDLPILVRKGGNQQLLDKLTTSQKYYKGSQKVRDSLKTSAGAEFAYIDKTHNPVVPFGTYSHAEPFGLNRKAIVAKNGRYGIIDEYGKLVLPLEYDFVERPSIDSKYANIFVAAKRDTVIILNENVEALPLPDIKSYTNSGANLVVSDRNGKKGLVNYSGELIAPYLYDNLYQTRISSYIGAYIAIKDGMYGYITQNNEIIRPFEYRNIHGQKWKSGGM